MLDTIFLLSNPGATAVQREIEQLSSVLKREKFYLSPKAESFGMQVLTLCSGMPRSSASRPRLSATVRQLELARHGALSISVRFAQMRGCRRVSHVRHDFPVQQSKCNRCSARN